MEHKKGQSAVEFMILISSVFFFAILLIVSIHSNISEKIETNRDKELLRAAYDVADEITLAYSSTDGYSRQFEVKGYVLNGVKYNITLVDDMVYIYTSDNSSQLSIHTFNAGGNVVVGNNIIRKIDGRVYLNS